MKLLNDMIDFEKLNENTILIIKKTGERLLVKNVATSFLNACFDELHKKIDKENELKSIPKKEWQEEEIKYLRDNLTLDINTLSVQLNRSCDDINRKIGKLKMINPKPWSKEDVEYLNKNINTDIWIVAKYLNRTVSSVKSKKDL